MSSALISSMAPLYRLCNQRRRRITTIRILLLAMMICYIFFILWFGPPNWMDTAQDEPLSSEKAKLPDAQLRSVIKTHGETSSGEENILHQRPSTASDDMQERDISESSSSSQGQSIEVQATDNNNIKPAGLNHFKESLKQILSLLPDEIHVRDLLRPIEGTGKEKLREIGLRARSFKTLFEAWEALHLISNDEAMYVRDDMVHYFRSHPELVDTFQMSLAQIIHSYETYRYFLARLSMLLFPWTAPYFSDHMMLHMQFHSGGRGIVLSAGDDQALFLLTSIPALRRLGCSLPIEIMYLGDDDLSEDFRADLELLPGVITRDLSQMVNDEGWTLAGWAGKPFAILLSSFREAIFIDADSLFFRNPEDLFEDPSYKETGALFFKDRLIMPESKKRWLQQILPKPISKQVRQSRFWTGESGHMQESGVVVVDKWKHFVALLLVTRMNGPDRDGNEDEGEIGVYDMVYGDKETFWLGWELVGDLGYSFHGGDAGIMGTIETQPQGKEDDEDDQDELMNSNAETQDEPAKIELRKRDLVSEPMEVNFTICAPQLLHLGTDDRPLWFNGWLLPNKYSKNEYQEPGRFEVYMKEPREVRDPGSWQLGENNICCLTSDKTFEFTQDEIDVLEMIIDMAREAGALGKR